MIKKVIKQFSLRYPCLTRDFIQDRLYNSQKGYFNSKNLKLIELKEEIDYKNIVGQLDHSSEIEKKYPANSFLSPSEMYKPFYGQTIANYIRNQLNNKPLKIIEVGSGSGADSILTYFKENDIDLYESLTYEIVEFSSKMANKCKKKLEINHHKLIQKGQIRINIDDILYWTPKNKNDHYFILFLEVLNNMPHDRIMKSNQKYDLQSKVYLENDKLLEKQEQINDQIIIETLKIYEQLLIDHPESQTQRPLTQKIFNLFYQGQFKDKSLFLPTYSYKILKNINKNIPNHNLIISDYDQLSSKIEGINAPSVQQVLKDQKNKNCSTYLLNYEADIYFPTNFQLLKALYQNATNKDGQIMKTYDFLNKNSKEQWIKSSTGYIPYKVDFDNTSIFVSKN